MGLCMDLLGMGLWLILVMMGWVGIVRVRVR